MAIAIKNPGISVGHRQGLGLDWPLIKVRVGRIARILAWTWIVLNVVQWGPTPDAGGNCGCPLCNPFGTSPRISAADPPPVAAGVQP